jgi:hydrogenase maturation protease
VTSTNSDRPLIIGIGNEMRSDDGAGIAVANRLRAPLAETADIEQLWGEGATLMEAWRDRSFVILIDAASSGASPGTIHTFEATNTQIPRDFLHYSTHRFGVAEAIELARSLDLLPPRIILHAIEGQVFDYGTALSPAVDEAINMVAKKICNTLGVSDPID